MGEVDVTNSIRVIERLKAELLGSVSDLYSNMLLPGDSETIADRTEILADITVLIYLMANRLGVPPAMLDSRAMNKLRVSVMDEHSSIRGDYLSVLSHMDKKRR